MKSVGQGSLLPHRTRCNFAATECENKLYRRGDVGLAPYTRITLASVDTGLPDGPVLDRCGIIKRKRKCSHGSQTQ